MTKVRHPEKVNNKETSILPKPKWIRSRLPSSKTFETTKDIIKAGNVVTVCEEANCPNLGECWSKKHATFMIMGDTCTRACAFCNVKTGKPEDLDPFEPYRISQTVKKLGLDHVVITSVDRDDLHDGGALHFSKTIQLLRRESPKTTIEILTPDFLRKEKSLEVVLESKPDVFNHNLETVPRLYLSIRPGARPIGGKSLELSRLRNSGTPSPSRCSKISTSSIPRPPTSSCSIRVSMSPRTNIRWPLEIISFIWITSSPSKKTV